MTFEKLRNQRSLLIIACMITCFMLFDFMTNPTSAMVIQLLIESFMDDREPTSIRLEDAAERDWLLIVITQIWNGSHHIQQLIVVKSLQNQIIL